MKKFIVATVLAGAISFGLEWLLPWWVIAVIPFLVCVIMLPKPGQAFLAGFLGIGLVWTGMILWRLSDGNIAYMESVAELFMLPPGLPYILGITVFIGALIGGLSGYTGGLFRKMFS